LPSEQSEQHLDALHEARMRRRPGKRHRRERLCRSTKLGWERVLVPADQTSRSFGLPIPDERFALKTTA